MEGSLRSDGEPFGRLRVAGAEQAESLSVGFVGSGRAARSLARSLARRGHRLLIAEHGESAARLASDLDGELVADALALADVTILAVPDARVAALAESLAATSAPGQGRVVLHLAGSLGLQELAPLAEAGYAIGAMHPLQVLSGWRIPPGTTFAVEADPIARTAISRLVADLGGVELDLPAGGRVAYHAAAVIPANLGMTLLAEAVALLQRQGVR